MNSIILSFGLPKNAGVSCAFLLTEEVVQVLQNEDVRFQLIKMNKGGIIY